MPNLIPLKVRIITVTFNKNKTYIFSMAHLIKDAFYNERLYQMSITTFSQAETMFAKDKSKIKELSKVVSNFVS